MKRQEVCFKEVDLSRYHILGYDEMLSVNGGSGEESESYSDSEDDANGGDASENTDDAFSDGHSSSDTATESVAESYLESSAESEAGFESGGHEVENSHSGVANAEVGDTITRDDGTEVTLTQADIDYEQSYCDAHGISWGEEKESGTTSSENITSEEVDGSFPSQTAPEDTAKDSYDKSSENVGTAAAENNKNSVSESSYPVSASHGAKSGHGFFDSVSGWFDAFADKFNATKDWFCDALGIGESQKIEGNIVVEPTLTPTQKIEGAIKTVGTKDYVIGKYQCDEYVNDVLKTAGYEPKDYYVDNPSGKNIATHISELKNSGDNYSMKVPTKEGVYVVFMDGEGALGKLSPHCGLLTVEGNGDMTVTHNSSVNRNAGVDDWSVISQKNGTKLSEFAYSNFYFQEVK